MMGMAYKTSMLTCTPCSRFPQPLVLLAAVEHQQLQAIVPCCQVHLLHLRTHRIPIAVNFTFQ